MNHNGKKPRGGPGCEAGLLTGAGCRGSLALVAFALIGVAIIEAQVITIFPPEYGEFAVRLRANSRRWLRLLALCERRLGIQSDDYFLRSYRIATAPEPNSSQLTSFKSTCFDSPANNVGP